MITLGTLLILSLSPIAPLCAGGNDNTIIASMTPNGSFVTFQSKASNLCSNDLNSADDVFLWTRSTRQVQCISISPDGSPSKGPSGAPTISADGTAIAFMSASTTLVKSHATPVPQIYIWDANASIVRLSSDINGLPADSPCRSPTISGDGQFVVFESRARNLLRSESDTDKGAFRLFHFNTKTHELTVHDLSDNLGNGISIILGVNYDGRAICFQWQPLKALHTAWTCYELDVTSKDIMPIFRKKAIEQLTSPEILDFSSCDHRLIAVQSIVDRRAEGEVQRRLFLIDRKCPDAPPQEVFQNATVTEWQCQLDASNRFVAAVYRDCDSNVKPGQVVSVYDLLENRLSTAVIWRCSEARAAVVLLDVTSDGNRVLISTNVDPTKERLSEDDVMNLYMIDLVSGEWDLISKACDQ